MIRHKFLVIGKYNDCDDYCYPEIIYSSVDHKNEYYKCNGGDGGLKDSKELTIRAYNHHYRDKEFNGIVIANFKYEINGFTKEIENIYNGFKLEDVQYWYERCWDAGIGGQIGNIDTSWELSDLNSDDHFISINEYLPEDLCFCLYGGLGDKSNRSYTKECVCKLNDGSLKFSYRLMIDPYNDNEKIEWIEEWSKRQLKNAQTKANGYGSEGPAYHWVMPKEFADKVIAWRWFKEGEKKYQYM